MVIGKVLAEKNESRIDVKSARKFSIHPLKSGPDCYRHLLKKSQL
jgi:hypothetical protein